METYHSNASSLLKTTSIPFEMKHSFLDYWLVLVCEADYGSLGDSVQVVE